MNWVDLFVLIIVIASTVFGVWRGFVKEAIALTTWLAAIWLAWRFAGVVEPWLGDWLNAPELKIWVARAITFVGVIIIGGVIAWLTRALVHSTGLSGTDRMLGGLFGLVRSGIVFGLIVIALQLSGLDQDPWWQQARLRGYGERLAAAVRYYAELGTEILEENNVVVTTDAGQ